MLRHIIINIVEHLPPIRLQFFLRRIDLRKNLLPNVFRKCIFLLFIPPSPSHNVILQFRNGMSLGVPRFNLFRRTIGRTIVRRRMVTDAVGHGLQYDRFVILQCIFTGDFRCIVNGKDVGAIDANCCYSIAGWSTASDSVSFVLFGRWR